MTLAELYRCQHCGYADMRGKKFGWVTCSVWRCGVRICSGCEAAHMAKAHGR